MLKITIVSGARPNFMKIAPICRAITQAQSHGKAIAFRLVYTGRADDGSLEASLFPTSVCRTLTPAWVCARRATHGSREPS